MYDAFSLEYDRFVNWSGRLASEMPFLLQQLQNVGAKRVLDAACGTGMHAIALAQLGYSLAGADQSAGMVNRARNNADASGVAIQFKVASFGELAPAFPHHAFDGLLCLGNSLPHVLTTNDLQNTLKDFAASLRPGGVLIIQNRNFDAVLNRRDRWMEPQAHREGDREWIFLRFYDFNKDCLIGFNIIMLVRDNGDGWNQQVSSTLLRPLQRVEILSELANSGFKVAATYGGMDDTSFDPATSTNLVIIAIRN